jgi:MFS family permease
MCSIGAVGGIMQHMKLYLVDHQFQQMEAAKILSAILAFSLIGRLLMGFMADKFNRKYVMIIIYLLVGCSIPLLIIPDFQGKIYLFAFIFGIGLGGDYMIIPLMAGDLFGVNVLGRVMGIILVADGVAEATFPMLVGRLYDATGSYNTGFIVLICLALLGTIIVSFLPGTKKETNVIITRA